MRRSPALGLLAELLVLLVLAVVATLWAEPPSRFALIENSLIRWLLFSIPYLLFVGRRDLPKPETRFASGALTAIFLLSLVLSFSLRALPFHPFHWMNDLVGRVSSEPEPTWYANGYGLFMWLFTLPGLTPEQAIFIGNRVAGALTPLALFGVVRSLGGDSRHALWSALFLATLPLQVRLSASETMQIVPTLMVLISVIGFAGHARSGNRALLLAGIAAFADACLTRPDVSVIALALPLLYWPVTARPRLRDPWLLVGVALALLIGGPMVLAGAQPHGVALVSPQQALQNFAESLNHAGAPHTVFSVLALMGALLLLRAGQTWKAFFLAMALFSHVMLTGFEMHEGNRLQLLIPKLPWLAAAAGMVPGVLGRLLAAHLSRGILVTSMAVIVGWGWGIARAPLWSAMGSMQKEWLFLDRALPVLEHSGLTRVVRPQRPDFFPDYIASLPEYRLPHQVRTATMTEALAGTIEGPFVWYRSPDCQGQPMCTVMETRFHLRPLVTEDIDGATIGFFEASARPVEGATGQR